MTGTEASRIEVYILKRQWQFGNFSFQNGLPLCYLKPRFAKTTFASKYLDSIRIQSGTDQLAC